MSATPPPDEPDDLQPEEAGAADAPDPGAASDDAASLDAEPGVAPPADPQDEVPPPPDDSYFGALDDPGFDAGFDPGPDPGFDPGPDPGGDPALAAPVDGGFPAGKTVQRVARSMRSPTSDLSRAGPRRAPQRSDDLSPPADLDAERALLSSALIDSRAVALVLGVVRAEDFYDVRHGVIFTAMSQLFANNVATEPIAVSSELRRMGEEQRAGGLKYLMTLTGYAGSSLSVDHYAQTVARLAQVRRILTAAHRIQVEGYKRGSDPDEVVNLVQNELATALDRAVGARHVKIDEVVPRVFDNVLKARQHGNDIVGIPYGYRDLDSLTYGLHRTNLVILAARPAMGKTAFALNVALNVALGKVPDGDRAGQRCSVLFFSLEMGADELVQRLLAQRARVGIGDLRKGTISDSDEVDLRNAATDLSQLSIFIDDTPGISTIDVRARAKRIAMSDGLDLIVVDYLQLMKGTGGAKQSREQEISEISRTMKGLAKELNCTVIALSQLNRSLESRADKRPIMSDLRESGAIEQDADIILFVYRDWVYHKETAPEESAELIIGKHRAGKLGTVHLHFEGRFTRFVTVDDRFNDEYTGAPPFG